MHGRGLDFMNFVCIICDPYPSIALYTHIIESIRNIFHFEAISMSSSAMSKSHRATQTEAARGLRYIHWCIFNSLPLPPIWYKLYKSRNCIRKLQFIVYCFVSSIRVKYFLFNYILCPYKNIHIHINSIFIEQLNLKGKNK